jgi:hypothetical protein
MLCLHFRGRESAVGISDQLRVGRFGDRIPAGGGGADFPHPSQTGHVAHPASYTMSIGSFSGVKRPGIGVDHPPHLAPRLKKEWINTVDPGRPHRT